jgi:hypothetical protein
MEFVMHNTFTVPLHLATPAEDEVVQTFHGPESRSLGERGVSGEEGGKQEVNIFYRFLTGHIMPFFLMFQWVLELCDDSVVTTGHITLATILLIVAMFSGLVVLYRKTMRHNLWALLAPLIFLTVANMLVLFHCDTVACLVMGGGLVGMAGAILFERCYGSRDKNQERLIHEREWLLQEEHNVSFGFTDL